MAKSTRLYGLFIKNGSRWERLKPSLAFKKETAIRIFQGDLLDGFERGEKVELRVLPKPEPTEPMAELKRLQSMFTFGAILEHKKNCLF